MLAELQARADFDALDMPALMNALVADGATIEVQYVHGHWRGVNDLEDLISAVDFAHAQTPIGKTPDARGRVSLSRPHAAGAFSGMREFPVPT